MGDFRSARTLEELAKLGPCEMPALEYGLAMLGKPGDLATAIRLAEARTRTGSIDHAVYWVQAGRV